MIRAVYFSQPGSIVLVAADGNSSFPIPEQEAAAVAVAILRALSISDLSAVTADPKSIVLEPEAAWIPDMTASSAV